MKYYEIVRLEGEGCDTSDFDVVKKMVNRGWLRKALEFLKDWDYGTESLAAAISLGKLRDTVVDPLGNKGSEHILYERNGLHLCEAACPSGLYNAYYLVGECPENVLAEL